MMRKKPEDKPKLLPRSLALEFHIAIGQGWVREFAALCHEHNPRDSYGRFNFSIERGAKAAWHKMSVLELAEVLAKRWEPSTRKDQIEDIVKIAHILSRHNN